MSYAASWRKIGDAEWKSGWMCDPVLRHEAADGRHQPAQQATRDLRLRRLRLRC